MLKALNKNNFQEEIEGGLKLVEFYAPWCGYCRKEEFELKEMDKIWIGQVNTDEEIELTERFGIRSFPTFLIFKNGKEFERFSGFRKKEDLMNILMKHIKD